MSDDNQITIEVDGQRLPAQPNQMLIEVTDAAGITVPRFCYHKKLSVAANCRMCLVEVEGAPKPLPACATPVRADMKVFTKSPLAREAQQGTMEFLLINHPLDCPICDQGGECELQDVAMGYGGDVSRFTERKRVVRDENIGSLIATDMTRCIHCTRCVRFGAEIAGLRELGATGRGEHMRIGVFVEQSVASELSGNIIDLCPVGALTSKPYRFTARAWELTQHEGIAPHDGVGSNLFMHLRRGQIMRVVPRDNEPVNETWIADRDRFGYAGLQAPDRLLRPMVRQGNSLREADWSEALRLAAEQLQGTDAERLAALIGPLASLEEHYLTQQLLRGLGSHNIDHRLRQIDFRGDDADPPLPWLGQTFAELERNDATLLIGSWLRKEHPLLNHRLRKSVLAGGQVMAINPAAFDVNYDLSVDVVAVPSDLLGELLGVARALGQDPLPGVGGAPDEAHQAIAEALREAGQGSVLLGQYALQHPDFSLLRQVADAICTAADVKLGLLADGGNAVGGWLAGSLPHRLPDGSPVAEPGRHLGALLQDPPKTCLLVQVEPEQDFGDAARACRALASAGVIAITPYRTPWLEAHADILLPVGVFAESSGTLVNLQGDRQSYEGVASLPGEARPAWKVLRVLGNLTGQDGFDDVSSAEVRDRALAEAAGRQPDNRCGSTAAAAPLLVLDGPLQRIGGFALHGVDGLVRRSKPLQHAPDNPGLAVRLCAATATAQQLSDDDTVRIQQGDISTMRPVAIDDRVPEGCVWMPLGIPDGDPLGAGFGEITLEKA